MRYAVISIDPPAHAGIQRRYLIQVLGTGLLALLIFRLARGKSYGLPLSACALLAGGYFWGNVITRINGDVERGLLLLVIPAACLMARFMGTNRVEAMALLLPVILAFAGELMATVLTWFLLYFGPAGLGFAAAAYGGYIAQIGFAIGVALAVWALNRRRREGAFAGDEAVARLATTGCAAFYAGYCLGWWKLWQYSPDAFLSLL